MKRLGILRIVLVFGFRMDFLNPDFFNPAFIHFYNGDFIAIAYKRVPFFGDTGQDFHLRC